MRVTRIGLVSRSTALLLGGVLVGCTGGELGEEGRVRFSQSMGFTEVQDFQAPVAAGRPVWVTLEDPAANPRAEGRHNLDLTLEVVREGAEPFTPPKRDDGVYDLKLEGEGSWTLLARDGEAEIDRLGIRSAELAAVRVSESHKLSVTHPEGRCWSVSTHATGLSTFVLRRNQTLHFHAIPVDAASAPMIGLLGLEVEAPGFLEVKVRAPKAYQTPNAIEVLPRAGHLLGEVAQIVVREVGTSHGFTLMLPTADEDAAVACAN